MVLKVHVVRGDGYRYYVDDLVPGRAEGSLVAGESPGIWSGRGAAALGLGGEVEAPAFGEVLEGRDPRSGSALRQSRGGRGVAGYDLTFCAPIPPDYSKPFDIRRIRRESHRYRM